MADNPFDVKNLVPQLANNSGSSASILGKGENVLTKDIQEASIKKGGTDYVMQSNQNAGFDYTRSASSGTQQGAPDLERIYTDSNKKLEIVGTNINEKNESTGGSEQPMFTGFRSIINPYHLVRYHSLMDRENENPSQLTQLGSTNGESNYKGLANSEAYKNPSTSFIINYFNQGGGKYQFERKYSYSDFLYLKHYHPFNNNRLITLRRFMYPVYDECRIALKSKKEENEKYRRPIAQAMNYLDVSGNSLSSLTKMSVEINVKDIIGAGQNSSSTPVTLSESAGALGLTGGNDAASQAGLKILSLLSGSQNLDGFQKWTSAYDPWSNGPLQDLVYGPVNVITGSVIRDRGLKFLHTGELKIHFEYSSKTIEHVNQKAAMLDILSNMLALSYNHAQFWGGENRFLIDRANFPLVRAEVMYKFLQDINSGKSLDESAKQLASSSGNIMEKFEKVYKTFVTGDINQIFSKENLSSLTQYFTQYALLDNSTLKNYQKTILEGTKAELTGAPTGEWHLQVGNPLAPIMMIGNLWCVKCDFEFNNEFSIDDFPTELKYSCSLKPGRSRDASDIQSIFNNGGGRIYYPQKNNIDVNASSSTFNSDMAVTAKTDQVLGATNRTPVDRAGSKIADLVKKSENNSQQKYATSLFQPIKTIFNK